jgi:hypothetical protein
MPSPLPFRRAVLAAVLCVLPLSGCAYRGRQAVTGYWADWNTLEQCAGYWENTSHKPLKPYRVDSYRWMYDRDPGQVIVYDAPHPTIFDHLRKHGLLHWIEDDDAHLTRFWAKVRHTVENPEECRERLRIADGPTCRDKDCPAECPADATGVPVPTPGPAASSAPLQEPRPAPPVDAAAPRDAAPRGGEPESDPYRILKPDPVASRTAAVRPSSHAAARSEAPSNTATGPASPAGPPTSARWLRYAPPVR